MRRPLRNSI